MQLIAHYTIAGFAAFKTAFDADAEDRANNHLGVLQIWRESDTSVWVLYDVRDAKAARAYLDGAAQVFHTQAGVSASDFHFVETA